ncbi:hypothetical protein J4536_23535, partial [Escherichia coli]|nr:hypothetical protein [Escherichia coli]
KSSLLLSFVVFVVYGGVVVFFFFFKKRKGEKGLGARPLARRCFIETDLALHHVRNTGAY